MTNTQNNQNLSLESSSITIQRGQLLPFVNDGRVLQHNMNTSPVTDKDQLKEGQDHSNNLSTSYKNLELSAIQSIQEDESYKQIQKELQDTTKSLETRNSCNSKELKM